VTKLFVLGIVTALNLTLGMLVLARNPRHWVNRAFALFAISVAAWSASGATNIAGVSAPLFWARWSFLAGTVILFALVLFLYNYPFRNELPRSKAFLVLTAAASLLCVLSTFTPFIVQNATNTPHGRSLTYGSLYRFFAAYVLWCLGYSIFLVVRRYLLARGAERRRLTYLFVALLVPLSLAITTNVVVPLITGSSRLSTYGPLFSVLMIAMIAHAIIRHRLMNVRLVLRRGVVYLISVAVCGSIFGLVIATADSVADRPKDLPLAFQVVLALAIALAFQPLKRWIQQGLDRYFYREEYDYPLIIRQASTRIASILDLQELLNYLSHTISTTLRPDLVAVYVSDKTAPAFSLASAYSPLDHATAALPASLPSTDPLVEHLLEHRQLLTTDEPSAGIHLATSTSAIRQLARLGGEYVFPMLFEGRLVGFILIGPKMSGDAYFSEDMELLTTLISQTGTAVTNAQLYGRVLLANEYIENILSTMDSGVITIDASGHVALCNSTAERLTGIPKSTLASLTVDELPHPLARQLRATLADGQPRLQIETDLPARTEQLPIVSSTAALTETSGTVLGALVVFTDLSKLKELEAEKRRAERLAAFGAFASGVAHEIKNPLVAIRTFAELLPERFSDPDFRDDFASVVIREISRIDDLVARLRGIAATAPKQSGTVDVREPIRDTVTLLRGQLEQSRTTVHYDFRDTHPLVVVDEAQLKQLFLNLMMNAVEAMGSGGDITVSVSRKQSEGRSTIVTEVADNGPGIPDGVKASIFDPFFTTKPRGSGLGLAICRGITDAHRGTIRAESGHGRRGTTITVELPAADSGSGVENIVEPLAITR
jgi:signal transduction histidine kinase